MHKVIVEIYINPYIKYKVIFNIFNKASYNAILELL
jgi:hypothetical protein